MSRDVLICEMAPRDGLQVVNRSATIPRDERVALVETLQRAGLQYIEAGAFVSPRRVPAMADTALVMAEVFPHDGELAVLVPNLKYFASIADTPHIDTVALFVSASEHYSQKNTRMNVAEALAAAAEVAAAAQVAGYGVRAHVSGAFRDLTEANGETPVADVIAAITALRNGSDDMVISLADTDGRAERDDIERVIGAVSSKVGLDGIGVHLHDRAGRGVLNARVAYDMGVRVFDAAVGGIGGNPTALADPVGNVATEALVEMFARLDADTGIDWELLIEAGAIVTRMCEMVGDPPPPSPVLARELNGRG